MRISELHARYYAMKKAPALRGPQARLPTIHQLVNAHGPGYVQHYRADNTVAILRRMLRRHTIDEALRKLGRENGVSSDPGRRSRVLKWATRIQQERHRGKF